MNNATICDPHRIDLFLAQKLSDDEQLAFELHLDDCAACRRRLESSAAGDDLWSAVRDSLRDPPMLPSPFGRGAGGEGNRLPSSFESRSGGDGEADPALDSSAEPSFSSQSTILKLLAPTDDDRMIGRWGTYEVVGVVGAGGMGVVLKAFDAALNRYVAIKILAPHLGASGAAIRRFSREGKAAAAVVHDNVIEIYGVSEAAGLPYLVMPYVRGPSLQRRLDDEGPLATVEILRVAMQAAAGLAAAHAQGLVHRDVKPANILLADGIERVKLTDFGLARAADDASLTRTGVIAGTPQYMSPEQARGEPVDPRSDLFSLGSVLYAMSTGRPPFRAETMFGVLRRITDEEPRPIREVNPDVPDWLAGIVSKLMSKLPDDRFQSAREVATLLEQCLAHVQQPTLVSLPEVAGTLRVPSAADSPLLPGEGGVPAQRVGVRALRVPSAEAGRPEQVRAVPALGNTFTTFCRNCASLFRPTSLKHRKLLTGTLAMLTFIALFAAGVVSTSPPDIAGTWQGDDWGQVTLTQTSPGEYTGTYTDTVVKDKGPGHLDLKWSRIERRFNGTWREGDSDRFGDLSIRLIEKEIRGALTTDAKSKINPATPRLADLTWQSANATTSATTKPNSSALTLEGADPKPQRHQLPEKIILPVFRFMNLDSVRREIGITPEQYEKLREISWAYMMEQEKIRDSIPPSDIGKESLVENASVRKRIEKVLTQLQLEKYKGLVFDRIAFDVLALPKGRLLLNLTPLQLAAYEKIRREKIELPQRLFQEATDKAMLLLNPQQARVLRDAVKLDFVPRAFQSLQSDPEIRERLDLTLQQIKGISDLATDISKKFDQATAEATSKSVNMLTADQRKRLHELVEDLDLGNEGGNGEEKVPETVSQSVPGTGSSAFSSTSKRVGVSLEWIELDCTKCPELAKRFQPDPKRSVSMALTNPIFADLEAKAVKRMLTRHVEWIVPGNSVNHTTRVDNADFDLQLSVTPLENGTYELLVRAARSVGSHSLDSLRPGTQLTPEQMKEAKKGIQTTQMAFSLRSPLGHSIAIGSMIGPSSSANQDVGRKMVVLIVGLEKDNAEGASHPRALHFDRVHYAKLDPPPKFTSGDFSISLWFNPPQSLALNPPQFGDRAWLFMRGFSHWFQRGDIGMALNEHGDLYFESWTEGSAWLHGSFSPGAVRYGQWNHAVLTRRGDTYTMWLNGARAGEVKSPADISDKGNSNPFVIGGFLGDGGLAKAFLGAIDDFRIFSRCLSDKDIGDLYKSNGDETFLQREGSVKVGPLAAVEVSEKPTALAAAPQLNITSKEALARVAKTLEPVLKQLNPQPQIEYPAGDASLQVSYHTRKYTVHTSGKGFVGKDVHEVTGPDDDGFVLGVNVQPRGEINQLVTPQTTHEPYWSNDLDLTPIAGTDKQLFWSFSYRNRAPGNILRDIRMALRGLQGEVAAPTQSSLPDIGPTPANQAAGLLAAQARFDAAKIKAEDETETRRAVAAAAIAKREYEYNKKANEQPGGSVPNGKLLELSLKCTETDLVVELAELQKRVAGEGLKIVKASLDYELFRRGSHSPSELELAKATCEAETAQAVLEQSRALAASDIEIRYRAATSAVCKAAYENAADANKQAPGSVPKAKLEELLLSWKQAELAVEKAKDQQRFAVRMAIGAKAKLEAVRRKADDLKPNSDVPRK